MQKLWLVRMMAAGWLVGQTAGALGGGLTQGGGFSWEGSPAGNTDTSSFQQFSVDTNASPRTFECRGVLCEVAANRRTAVIRHEEVPGLMPKMTMPFNVRDTNELRGLRIGDEIAFQLHATEEESWIELLKPIGAGKEVSHSLESVMELARGGKLKLGDSMPDAQLVGEDGRALRLSEFRGGALAFTFIYTRCGLPDFCPRMGHNFSRARELLSELSPGPTNWQFLSISFDPGFDKPEVLKRYAQNYRGDNADRWLFAAAPTNELATITPQLDFRFANDGGNLVHNLRTVVLDCEGRLYRQFNGNQYKPEELAQAVAEAAQSKSVIGREGPFTRETKATADSKRGS